MLSTYTSTAELPQLHYTCLYMHGICLMAIYGSHKHLSQYIWQRLTTNVVSTLPTIAYHSSWAWWRQYVERLGHPDAIFWLQSEPKKHVPVSGGWSSRYWHNRHMICHMTDGETDHGHSCTVVPVQNGLQDVPSSDTTGSDGSNFDLWHLRDWRVSPWN